MSTKQDRKDMVVSATGNGMKHSIAGETFLHVSHGDGNGFDTREVHLTMTSNDGEFAQGWFKVVDLWQAVGLPNEDDDIAEQALLEAAGGGKFTMNYGACSHECNGCPVCDPGLSELEAQS